MVKDAVKQGYATSMRAGFSSALLPENPMLGLQAATCIPLEKNAPFALGCLCGCETPRGRPPPPTRLQTQSPHRPLGFRFQYFSSVLHVPGWIRGSLPPLASGLHRQDTAVGRQAQPPWVRGSCAALAGSEGMRVNRRDTVPVSQ